MPKTPRPSRSTRGQSAPRRPIDHRTLYPLDIVYRRAGVAMPDWATVTAEEIPEPYRSMLVHEDDMTSTLERHYGGRVVLRALSTFTTRSWYFRRVLLAQEYSGRPVEMGAIRIKLSVFPPKLRKHILDNQIPLGRLLGDHQFEYVSHATAFVAITPNSEMMGVFWMREPRVLYGRRTVIAHDGQKIGDIVEVLPPV